MEALVIQGPKLATVMSQVKKLEVSVLVLGQKKSSSLLSWWVLFYHPHNCNKEPLRPNFKFLATQFEFLSDSVYAVFELRIISAVSVEAAEAVIRRSLWSIASIKQSAWQLGWGREAREQMDTSLALGGRRTSGFWLRLKI